MQGTVFSVWVALTTFGLAGCGTAAPPSSASATTPVTLTKATSYYVSPKGNDSNPGTSLTAPLRTIQKAVDAAQPGDTVFVRGGTYRETGRWAPLTTGFTSMILPSQNSKLK